MLTKKYRLTSSNDFKTVYKHGQKIRGRFGMLIMLSPSPSATNLTDFPKLGFVVSKKIGNAVERHKLTRQLRNLIHELMPPFEERFKNYRFTYIAFEKPATFAELKKELLAQLNKAVPLTHSSSPGLE